LRQLKAIPAKTEIKDQLKQVRKGNIIELRGQLVQVVVADGWN